jgi:hypothetical protein
LRINSLGKKLKKIARDSSPTITQIYFPAIPRVFFKFLRVRKNNLALKLCKLEKSVERREVSRAWSGDFHKLINICVEILMLQKYFSCTSARGLPCSRATSL